MSPNRPRPTIVSAVAFAQMIAMYVRLRNHAQRNPWSMPNAREAKANAPPGPDWQRVM